MLKALKYSLIFRPVDSVIWKLFGFKAFLNLHLIITLVFNVWMFGDILIQVFTKNNQGLKKIKNNVGLFNFKESIIFGNFKKLKIYFFKIKKFIFNINIMKTFSFKMHKSFIFFNLLVYHLSNFVDREIKILFTSPRI